MSTLAEECLQRICTRFSSVCLLIVFAACLTNAAIVGREEELNGRPVVGVLMQGIDWNHPIPPYKTYVMADYATYLQQSGAQVVPIKVNQSLQYYTELLKSINGVLFPGGGVSLTESGYGKTGKIIFDLAKLMNDQGDFFPLWGTCLGFELLNTVVFDPPKNMLRSCQGTSGGVYLPVNFTSKSKYSRLFGKMNVELVKILATQHVTGNYHDYCVHTSTFVESPVLSKFYRVLTTNVDSRGTEFISTVEAVSYPFYGTQYHPEKNNYWWLPLDSNIQHSYEAVQVSQYFSNFFVNECRKSSHRFPNATYLAQSVIQNYDRKYYMNKSEKYLI